MKGKTKSLSRAAQETLEEIKTRLWPKTKKELQRIMVNARQAVDRGEKYLKDISEKGIDNTRKLSLSFQREKLYYELGRQVASTARDKWDGNARTGTLWDDIKRLDRQIEAGSKF